MTYEEIADLCKTLGYRDKLRLAQFLIQVARGEEEKQNPQEKPEGSSKEISDPVQYVVEKLLKLKPRKKTTLLNAIDSMFQFKGGITEEEKERIFSELQHLKYIKVDKNDRIDYKID